VVISPQRQNSTMKKMPLKAISVEHTFNIYAEAGLVLRQDYIDGVLGFANELQTFMKQ